jgi:hypothetical protein
MKYCWGDQIKTDELYDTRDRYKIQRNLSTNNLTKGYTKGQRSDQGPGPKHVYASA